MMRPPAVIAVCLIVMAGVADAVTPLNGPDSIEPSSPPAEISALDYQDSPQLLEQADDEAELGLDTPEEEELTETELPKSPTHDIPDEEPAVHHGTPPGEPTDAGLNEQQEAQDQEAVDLSISNSEEEEGQQMHALLEHETEPHQHILDGESLTSQGGSTHSSVREEEGLITQEDSTTHVLKEERLSSMNTFQQTPDVLEDQAEAAGPASAASAADGSPPAAEAADPVAFASPPVSFSVPQGGSLTLPCGRPPSGAGVGVDVSWSHSGRVLVSGGQTVDDRRQLLADGSLRLTSARAEDDGTFTCHVSGSDGTVTAFKHHVHVLKQPTAEVLKEAAPLELEVITEPASGVTVVQKGLPAMLGCWVVGHPTATVTWTKQEGKLPYGEAMLQGPRLEIGQVDRTHRGTYLCTVASSDNRTTVRRLRLEVNFSPEVSALEPVVYSGEEHQAVISCQVFAHPPAEVSWRRPSGRPLRPGHHVATRDGDLFSLTVQVETEDLDTYLCTASNIFGTGEAAVVLTGRPGRPVVTSLPRGAEPRSYTLTWRAQSVPPVLAYKVLYRQRQGKSSRPSGLWRAAWREAVLPLDDVDDAADHRHQYVIGDLRPDSEYEAHVLAQNKHGWSEPMAGFRFGTAPIPETEAAVLHQQRQHIASAAGSDSASSVRAGVASVLICAAIALLNV